MEKEIKESLDNLNRDWEEFKKTNDDRLKAIEKKGSASSDFSEKMDKINDSMDSLTEKVEKIEALKNVPTSGDQKAEVKEVAAKASEAMQHYMKKGPLSTTEEHIQAIQKGFEFSELKLLAVNVDRDGGVFVMPERDSEIRKRIYESSPVRQLADSQSISSDALEFVYDDDEVEQGWVGETEARPETDSSQLSLVRIYAHEQYAQPRATQKLLDDASINMEAWLAGKVQAKFARSEATAFVSGNGVSQPKGFLSYPNGDGSFDTIEQVNSGSAGGVTEDGLISLQNALFEEFQGNAKWMMQRATAGVCRKLKDGEDRYLWSVSGDLSTGAMQNLLDKPVHFANDMPAIAANALAIAYGDFRAGYLIADRLGIRVLRDPYTTKGSVKFYTTRRVGGGVQQFQAIKLQKLAV
jgi:HK97 family phage major capsid protein